MHGTEGFVKTMVLALCCGGLLAACGGPEEDTDAGTMDSGTTDSGPEIDAGSDAGPPPAAMICAEQCASNSDCFIGTADVGLDCLGGRCRPNDCDEDLDCVALLSQAPCTGVACTFLPPWYTQTCTNDSGCQFTDPDGVMIQGACVEVGDDGTTPRNVCAGQPDASGECPGAQETITLPHVGDPGTIEVCAYHDAACERGSCGNPCSDDDECLLVANGWLTPCESDTDCRQGDSNNLQERSCIRVGSAQVCAQPAVPIGTPPNRAPDCTAQNIEVQLVAGGTFIACGNPAMCDAETMACVPRCLSDGDCFGSTPVCNETTGECECGQDADCADVDGHPVCMGGACRCAQDSDCADFPYGDVCVDGSCGCSAVTACVGALTFDGTSFVCVDPSQI